MAATTVIQNDEIIINVGAHLPDTIPPGDNRVWADVSHLLEAASNDLRDGELIHADDFNLFAAMSALEIMDPKMDSGIVCRYFSIDEAIENGVAPIPININKTIDVQCIIDLMDHLLACEATWHRGHSLAQTVFTCIYLLRPDRTSPHVLLHSYCRIIRATCSAFISVVSDARTHEEEDHFTMAFGLPLKVDGDEKCLSMINAVEETICRQLRASRALLYKDRELDGVEPLQANPDLEESYCKALLCRLRFRKHLYHVLLCMRRPQGRGLDLAKKHISSCLLELEHIVESSEFLSSNTYSGNCGHGVEDSTTASGYHPIGFDATLNYRLSAPTPPRAIKILSWRKAVDYFKRLLHDLHTICLFPFNPLLESILPFVVKFQMSQPDLVARALLQVLLIQDSKLYGRDPIFSLIIRSAALPELTKNHNIQKIDSVIQLGQLVINLLKILCTNTAWQRRKLGKILQDWRVIHIQLEIAFNNEFGEMHRISYEEDAYICKRILLWVEEQTYWIAFRFIYLGFELDLYTPTDYCAVYWYMYVVLMKLAEQVHIKMVVSNDTTKRKAKKKRDSLKDVTGDYEISPVFLFLQCQICLAEGLIMMLAALRNEYKLFQFCSPLNTEEEVFNQHFDLLQKACIPNTSSFRSFKDSTADASFSDVAAHNYFRDAQGITKELRSSGFCRDADGMSEVRQMEQVAEHNSIALNLCSAGALDHSLKVSFQFVYHPYFATAVVKRS